MFPLRDVIPSRTTPVVTVLIIALNVLAFFYEQSFDQQALDVFLRTWGFVPAVFAWPTIFTSMFPRRALAPGWEHVVVLDLRRQR
jgi:membrane associated rhomboid family serine protease